MSNEIEVILVGEQGPVGQGVQAGGTTGQFLRKKTDANFDTEWTDSSATVEDINDIVNVNIVTPQAGDLLQYDSVNGTWDNAPVNSLGFASTGDLNALSAQVTAVEGSVTAVEGQVQTLDGQLADKASVASVTALDTRVGGAETDIQALDTALAGKASATDVTTLTGRVSAAELRLDGVEGDVQTLDGALAGKADNATVTALDTRVGGAETRLDAVEGDVQYLDGQLAGKANAVHTHAIADVTLLQETLDDKAAQADLQFLFNQLANKSNVGHTHTLDELSNVEIGGATDGQVLTYDQGTSTWVPATGSGGGGASALSDLTDVDDALNPANGQSLVYNTSTNQWEAQTISGGGGGSTFGGELADHPSGVDIGTRYYNTTAKLFYTLVSQAPDKWVAEGVGTFPFASSVMQDFGKNTDVDARNAFTKSYLDVPGQTHTLAALAPGGSISLFRRREHHLHPYSFIGSGFTNNPRDCVFSGDGSRLFVAGNPGDGVVTVFFSDDNWETWSVEATVNLTSTLAMENCGCNFDGSKLWAASNNQDNGTPAKVWYVERTGTTWGTPAEIYSEGNGGAYVALRIAVGQMSDDRVVIHEHDTAGRVLKVLRNDAGTWVSEYTDNIPVVSNTPVCVDSACTHIQMQMESGGLFSIYRNGTTWAETSISGMPGSGSAYILNGVSPSGDWSVATIDGGGNYILRIYKRDGLDWFGFSNYIEVTNIHGNGSGVNEGNCIFGRNNGALVITMPNSPFTPDVIIDFPSV